MDPAASVDQELVRFAQVMRRLRAECAWKAAQTHSSLVRYLTEETAETIEAIETGDPTHLREELGDLLLQVFLHAVIAEEAGAFTLDDVARGITDKMIERNPHVFGPDPDPDASADEINRRWEAIKTQTRPERPRPADGLPAQLPALVFAQKVVERCAREGRDLPLTEVADAPELGEALLALVAGAAASGLDAEQALRRAVRAL